MLQDDRTFHRRQRMAAIAEWSVVGVNQPRAPLPIETAFMQRITSSPVAIFRPLALEDAGGVDFHRQVSYLVDAFDCLPGRVDVAFDSTWKAFESASTGLVTGNITDRLKKLAAGVLDGEVLEELLGCVPVQSCEYLFKRLVADLPPKDSSERVRHQPNRRLKDLNDPDWNHFIAELERRYKTPDLADHRKGAMLLRRAMRGELLAVGSKQLQLSLDVRSALLISGLMYTARNDRFHGESFSPFVSSAASIRTYTHPHFLFLASYTLLLSTWATPQGSGVKPATSAVRENLRENLASARALFGQHWVR